MFEGDLPKYYQHLALPRPDLHALTSAEEAAEPSPDSDRHQYARSKSDKATLIRIALRISC